MTYAYYVICASLIANFVSVTHVTAQLFCNEVKDLSQGSNVFLYHSSNNKVFISSLDGLNVFDGIHTSVYRPGTHNMFGSNIQSPFYEQPNGTIWFTTYQALHVYNPLKDDFEYMFMMTPQGDTIFDNYKAFYQEGTELYLKAGRHVFVYDMQDRRVTKRFDINLITASFLTITQEPRNKLLFAASQDTLKAYALDELSGFRLLMQEKVRATSFLPAEKGLWIGTATGQLLFFDATTVKPMLTFPVSKWSISDIERFTNGSFIFANFSGTLYVFDEHTQQLTDSFTIISADGCNAQIDGLQSVYMDPDSTLWIGATGKGVFYHNLKARKFEHGLKGFDITQILPYKGDTLFVLTRRNGILMTDTQGHVLSNWTRLPGRNTNFTAAHGTWINQHELLFIAHRALYNLDLRTGRIKALAWKGLDKLDIQGIKRVANGRIIASAFPEYLADIDIRSDTVVFTPYSDVASVTQSTLYFQEDSHANLYLSNDDVNIVVLAPNHGTKSHAYAHTLSIRGGVKCLLDQPDEAHLLIGNTEGLFRIKRGTTRFEQIRDKKDLLSRTIYSILGDENGQLWLGTNLGLIRYDPASNEARVFTLRDGIQEREYNTDVSLVLPDGKMLFGGVNGMNCFHPGEVTLSMLPVKVYVSGMKINDERNMAYLIPEFEDAYQLKYSQNTISFNFHAIDFTDPETTRVKYRLEGVDRDYVETESANGFVRYSNLSPGSYTLSLIGSNADGNWNTEIRRIPIVIGPPFWRTWWFMVLLVGVMAGVVFLSFHSYYRRQLREKMIIIEKQQAVEEERTRIAAEMHDDLGSGLTTIRYLSDKALKQARDREEVAQIKRISEQSNALVRNMSEIIWAMNSRFDNAENLIGYLRRYASEFLEEHQIPLKFISPGDRLHEINMGGEKRRNIFLVFKEILHNTVKYSDARSVIVEVTIGEDLLVQVREIGGKGFDPLKSAESGNGLYNCQKRMQSIRGSIGYERKEDAMEISILLPLQA